MKNRVVVPIFNNEYKVIVSWDSLDKVRRLMKDWGYTRPVEQLDLDNRRGVTFYDRECHPIIVLPKYPTTAQEIGTLSHEAVHAVVNIFDKIQSKYDDEIFAHSVGAIVRKVLEQKSKRR